MAKTLMNPSDVVTILHMPTSNTNIVHFRVPFIPTTAPKSRKSRLLTQCYPVTIENLRENPCSACTNPLVEGRVRGCKCLSRNFLGCAAGHKHSANAVGLDHTSLRCCTPQGWNLPKIRNQRRIKVMPGWTMSESLDAVNQTS